MTQEQALDILKMGHNVFLTGPAGSGKTYLLNKYISYLKENEIAVAVTASTGIAASHMDGRTIHSWSAIGVSSSLNQKELNNIIYKPDIRERINNAKVLIIDEISMLDARRFDLVELICRTIRKKATPFGGLQVILCGDFFQLPPVPTKGEPLPQFVFSSHAWKKTRIVICYLEKQYRQEDTRFLNLLNEIRNSETSELTRDTLMERYQKPIKNVSKPTKLYAINHEVNTINDYELAQINGEAYTFNMTSSGDAELIRDLKKTCLAPQRLILKKGASVMFVKNNYNEDDPVRGYVNGTLGTVVDFSEDDGFPIVEKSDGIRITASPRNWAIEDDGVELARINQVPLRLAWAITIHKSQGMSLDYAEIDLGKAFTHGMGYVALSRVRTLNGIKLMGLNNVALNVNPIVSEIDIEFQKKSQIAKMELESLSSSQKSEFNKVFLYR